MRVYASKVKTKLQIQTPDASLSAAYQRGRCSEKRRTQVAVGQREIRVIDEVARVHRKGKLLGVARRLLAARCLFAERERLTQTHVCGDETGAFGGVSRKNWL